MMMMLLLIAVIRQWLDSSESDPLMIVVACDNTTLNQFEMTNQIDVYESFVCEW